MEILKGTFAFEGIVIGRVFLDRKELTNNGITTLLDEREEESEIERFRDGLEMSKESLERLKTSLAGKIGEKDLEIITAHLMVLDDPVYISDIEKYIQKNRTKAEDSVKIVTDKYISLFNKLENPIYRQKVLDIKDVEKRIIRNLNSRKNEWVDLNGKILITEEIFPTELLNIYHENIKLKGIIMEYGGETSHLAILAKALEIPTLMGIKNIFSYDWKKDVILDTTEQNSCVIIEPDEKTLEEYKSKIEKFNHKKEEMEKTAFLPAVTLDGIEVSLNLNISGKTTKEEIEAVSPDGIGLLRTELLYMKSNSFPDEEEQLASYNEIINNFDEKSSIIIRTLDIGADKQLPYFQMKNEMNSFLGLRGIRFSLSEKNIFKIQLRAILRAAYNRNVKLMYPMITNISEIREANILLEEVKKELKQEGKNFKEDIEVGIMIEVPSAVLMADIFAQEVDFFSIGTNDLTQYILAADRLSETVSDMYDSYNPAVLRAVFQIKEAADKYGKSVSICGEMAGQQKAIVAFLSMGITNLSMVSGSILAARALIRNLDYTSLKPLRTKILQCRDSNEVKEILKNYI
ncbi:MULTISPECIES: phosphoenolpyruvate--protein phosphotransferase [Fusobacterium]|uniref:phosphoenolpyruvate--protein phosphotransferase n=1 Tax=Fusobacterium TaxID=848 RepID=UPI0008C2BF7F|nr:MULTISPECIES: phosphoenolpyruvate--protein phosphotransferase [Fusobacterium]OFL90848.1 phosphoenolpyruvate--protein phosphotransferase [Fusobacterium sp. HMSC073F01]